MMYPRGNILLLACGCGALALAVGGSARPAGGQCEYEMTDIPIPPCAFFNGGEGLGINDLAHVVGYYSNCEGDSEIAFVWRGEPMATALPFPWVTQYARAKDINNRGHIVGMSEIDGVGNRGFFFDGETFINLGTLPGGNYSDAAAVNEHGQITGTWGNNVTGDPGLEAFIWEEGVLTGLGEILETPYSTGEDINDKGWVVGSRGETISTARGFLWDRTTVHELMPLPDGLLSVGTSINNQGQIAGYSMFLDPDTAELVINATLWLDADDAPIDLGRLPGFRFCRAYGINEAGVVTGHCYSVGMPITPFVWLNGEMFELVELVVGEDDEPSTMWAINNHGQIAGTESTSPIILSPIASPPTDVTGDCLTNGLDLLVLLSAWGEFEHAADFNGDGIVGFPDLLLLLDHWS